MKRQIDVMEHIGYILNKLEELSSDVPSDFSGSNRDYHFVYCGEIVNA